MKTLPILMVVALLMIGSGTALKIQDAKPVIEEPNRTDNLPVKDVIKSDSVVIYYSEDPKPTTKVPSAQLGLRYVGGFDMDASHGHEFHGTEAKFRTGGPINSTLYDDPIVNYGKSL